MQIASAQVGPVEIRWRDVATTGARGAAFRGTASGGTASRATAVASAEHPRADLSALGGSQVRRYAELDGIPAERFAAGRLMLAELIRGFGGPSADTRIDAQCPRCGGEHGAAHAVSAPVAVCVSYAGPLVVVAAAPCAEVVRLGIDVERNDEAGAARVRELAPLFAPDPPPDIAGWTRIEAVLKADGRGVEVDPADVVHDVWGAASARFPEGLRMRLPGVERGYEAVAVEGPEGYALTLAVAWA